MAITPKQRIERMNFIGATDTMSILGLNPWSSPADVLLSKEQYIEENKIGTAAQCGNILEPYICAQIEDKYSLQCTYNPDHLHFVCDAHPIFACNLDGLDSRNNTASEAKFTTQWQEWGHDSDQIPNRYYIQVQHQMMCTGFEFIYVGVWIALMKFDMPGFIKAMVDNPLPIEHWRALSSCFDTRVYKVHRNEDTIRKIVDYGEKWWERYVVPAKAGELNTMVRAELPVAPGTFSNYNKIKRIDGKRIAISLNDWYEFDTINKQRKEHKHRFDCAKSKLLATMGDAQLLEVTGTPLVVKYARNGQFIEIDTEDNTNG